MSTYVIGDVQGCMHELEALLTHIAFHPGNDTLWFTGDLVNRGPRSLDVLRFVKSLGDKHIVVLGNHDLHLLAVAYGVRALSPQDTLEPILIAPDREELMFWLRHRPLLHDEADYVMVHAGLAPVWTRADAQALAREAEDLLQSDDPSTLLKNMYGNTPDHWQANLNGMERARCIINYLTRMRYCYADGRMELAYKGTIENKPGGLIPWFDVPNRVNRDVKIIFGHWAALDGKADVPNVYPLDTGCVWGRKLTAMRLDDEKRFSVNYGA